MNCDMINKRIKQLMSDRDLLIRNERANQTYSYLHGEKAIIPEYSFVETTGKIDEINEEILKLKHAVNVFNSNTKIPGTDMTVDMALIKLPILTDTKRKLERMRGIPETQRTLSRAGNVSEYTERNFSIDEVEDEYKKVCESLVSIQQGLNVVNLTMEVEV